MEQLHPEVFRMLFAVGWIDGELRPSEAHLILEAAKAENYDDETMAMLQGCANAPVDFGELDQGALTSRARLYVYAVSSWIARADGRVSKDEVAALHAIATVVGVTGRGRQAMDEVVTSLDTTGDFDQKALREAISKVIEHVRNTPAPTDRR